MGHKDAAQCIQRASPGKYWMSRGQRNQVRGQRFIANSVDNWFCLFEILLPDAILVGSGSSHKNFTPCKHMCSMPQDERRSLDADYMFTNPSISAPTIALDSPESGGRSAEEASTVSLAQSREAMDPFLLPW